ncbi:hypothetical protein B0H21DRAFT_736814 [Amylocystis lapponica]|nr:hypothetical protein B0H21DRAFT_736814 [Amylocystis lapponica]
MAKPIIASMSFNKHMSQLKLLVARACRLRLEFELYHVYSWIIMWIILSRNTATWTLSSGPQSRVSYTIPEQQDVQVEEEAPQVEASHVEEPQVEEPQVEDAENPEMEELQAEGAEDPEAEEFTEDAEDPEVEELAEDVGSGEVEGPQAEDAESLEVEEPQAQDIDELYAGEAVVEGLEVDGRDGLGDTDEDVTQAPSNQSDNNEDEVDDVNRAGLERAISRMSLTPQADDTRNASQQNATRPIPDPNDPDTDDPDVDDPDLGDPDLADPGTKDPGTKDPGTKDPGTKDPGTKDPDTKDPERARIPDFITFATDENGETLVLFIHEIKPIPAAVFGDKKDEAYEDVVNYSYTLAFRNMQRQVLEQVQLAFATYEAQNIIRAMSFVGLKFVEYTFYRHTTPAFDDFSPEKGMWFRASAVHEVLNDPKLEDFVATDYAVYFKSVWTKAMKDVRGKAAERAGVRYLQRQKARRATPQEGRHGRRAAPTAPAT